MLKTLWQKVKQNHLLMMAICCLAPLVLIIGLFSLFKVSNNYWWWLIILLCPLMHIFMMKGHRCKKNENQNSEKKFYNCPRCGLGYKDKQWAEKCEEWCKNHKSCNLEITSHAVKK